MGVLVDFDLDVAVTVGSGGYYGRNEAWSEQNFMHPNIQPGNFMDTLYPTFNNMRMQKGVKRLQIITTKLPVQNWAVKDNEFPVNPSVEQVPSI